MKKISSFIKQPGLSRLALWHGLPRPAAWSGPLRERKSLFTGLAVVLLLLLVFTWFALLRQVPAPARALPSTSPALLQVEPPRRDSSLVYDPLQHVVLLFGGTLFVAGDALTNETWAWNGVSWQQLHPRTSPPALQGTMVYDAASRQVILFLNQVSSTGTIANEMWTWDGHDWHQLQPALMPEVTGASLAYDAARGLVLLFGAANSANGGQAGTLTSVTWTWNGSAWQEQHPLTSPSPRTAAALAYDEALQQIVLFGGITANGLTSETWLWNGANWQQLATPSLPSPRQNGLLVYDSASRQLLLFGGISADGTQPLPGETWSLQAHGWSKISATGAPSALYASTAYDAATSTVLVYAAQGTLPKNQPASPAPPVSQTWTWDGSKWHLL